MSGARSVHEAAVEAVAGALDALFMGYSEERLKRESRVAIAALVTSAEVREGLGEAAADCDPTMERWAAASATDAILAALGGTEASRG